MDIKGWRNLGTDASDVTIGALLEQLAEDVRQLIGFFSRQLKSVEKITALMTGSS